MGLASLGPPLRLVVEADGRNVMKRTWTIIGVSDVPSSFKWYQSLFGQPRHNPPIPSLVRSSIRMELFCSASTSGARTSIRR